MRYPEFKSAIQKLLQRHRQGATWNELREKLSLPTTAPAPNGPAAWKKKSASPAAKAPAAPSFGKSHQ